LKDNLPICSRFGTRDTLGDVFRYAGLNKGVEVGVREGAFSVVLCQKNPDIELYCVDKWRVKRSSRIGKRYYRKAKKNLAPYHAVLVKKTSMEAVKDFADDSLDFVYIDANHEFDYVCPDIIFWSQKIRQGGIVACHDYYNHPRGGVVRAVDAYTGSHHIDPWYVTKEIFPTAFWVKP